MRHSVREYVALCERVLDCPPPIYEFGSYQVQGQEDLANLRPLFAGKTYVGADLRMGPGVDVVMDVEHIDLPDASAGTVLCLDTIEHVQHPWLACEEFARILRPDGYLLLSSQMYQSIHAYPDDYWRFTPSAFRVLLHDFAFQSIAGSGPQRYPRAVVAVAAHSRPEDLQAEALEDGIRSWRMRMSSPTYLLQRARENPGAAWAFCKGLLPF